MSRPTKELKTAGGHTVVVKETLIGRESRIIRNAMMVGVKPSEDGGELTQEELLSSMDAATMERWENALIEALVISVDGETEGCLDRVLDLPAADYQEVFELVTSMQGQISSAEKKG